MRLGHRKRYKDEAQIDMTSMLDIVFIMLIFFIVTSSFVRESGMEVNRPAATNASSLQDKGVFVAISSDNQIYIDKRLVDVARVQASLERIVMEQGVMEQGVMEQGHVSLVIQADELAFNGTVVRVMDAAKGAGIQKIALATEPQ